MPVVIAQCGTIAATEVFWQYGSKAPCRWLSKALPSGIWIRAVLVTQPFCLAAGQAAAGVTAAGRDYRGCGRQHGRLPAGWRPRRHNGGRPPSRRCELPTLTRQHAVLMPVCQMQCCGQRHPRQLRIGACCSSAVHAGSSSYGVQAKAILSAKNVPYVVAAPLLIQVSDTACGIPCSAQS